MKAIILCAGQGRRLLPLTLSKPKCALPIAGQPMLKWQLGEIARCGIDEVVVVTGFGADLVDELVNETELPPTRTQFNPFFALSDNLGTCWVARHEMHEPFVIINGDTLFEAAILQHLLAVDSAAAVTLVTDRKPDYDDDDMKVLTNGSKLLRVDKQLTERNGESIGMILFRGAGPDLFRATVERMMRVTEGTSRWYLKAIDEMARAGHVDTCCIEGMSWCEVDDVADLRHAQDVVTQWPSFRADQPNQVETKRRHENSAAGSVQD